MWNEIKSNNIKHLFNQYFLILNNTDEKDTKFNYNLDDKNKPSNIFKLWSSSDFTDDPITILRDCSCKTEFYIANVNDARYVKKKEYEEALTELTEILKKYYPNFEGYEFVTVTEYDIPESTQGVKFEEPLYDIGVCINYRKLYDWSVKHDVDLEDFLTNKKYIVIIEDKRNQFFAKLVRQGYINKDIIENYDEILEIVNATKEDD